MLENYSRVMKFFASFIAILLFMTATHAEEVTNVEDSKGTSNNIQSSGLYHPKVKRAWNQFNGGWGKRASEGDAGEDESIEQLQRKLMKLYADQLLANRLNDEDLEYYNGDNENGVDKRAWNQLQSGGWGKRDWSQLRGNFFLFLST